MSEVSIARIGEAVDDLCCDLDEIINRLVRPHAVLRLEHESDRWWIVVDDRNDQIMLRAEYPTCVRFAQAFVRKHPGASMDRSFGLAEGSPAREEFAGSGEEGTGGVVSTSFVASPDQHSVRVDHLDVAQVIPIRRGVA